MLTGQEIRFVVEGQAVPWARARQGRSKKTGKPVFFSAAKARNFSALIRDAWRQVVGTRAPRLGPVRLTVMTFWPIPVSRPRAWRLAAEAETTPYVSQGRHDWDNLGKIVGDALNQIAWVDDGQIYMALVSKMYSPRPRMEVAIVFEG